MDKIFKALADPVRREILDRLLESDGATLSELCEGRPMSRFGVMKHLDVLENAHLVVYRRVGRKKLHYLDTVPIRKIQEGWIEKYSDPASVPGPEARKEKSHEG